MGKDERLNIQEIPAGLGSGGSTPTTPWIVFDRDSIVDNQPFAFAAKAAMRAGVAFTSNPDIRLPAPAPAPEPLEPSSLIVARDFNEEAAPAFIAPKRGGLKVAIAAAAFMGIAAGITAAFVHTGDAPASAQAATPPVAQVVVAPPVTPAPIEAAAPIEPAPAPLVTPAEVVGEFATDPKKRWGTLTIKPDAKTKNVWFDGKRMLGTGKRSFMVYCGMHTIAVNEKAEQKDMEVPCNGELTIGK